MGGFGGRRFGARGAREVRVGFGIVTRRMVSGGGCGILMGMAHGGRSLTVAETYPKQRSRMTATHLP